MTKLTSLTKETWIGVLALCPVCFFFGSLGFDNVLVGVFAAQTLMASLATLGTLAVGIVTVVKA
jgi:hypothetical protein